MIRTFSAKDKPYLINLINLNTPTYFDAAEEKDFIVYLEKQIEDYYVIEQDNVIIGCGGINYETDKNTAIISWDIIHPDFQKKGLGKELLVYRINRIKDLNSYANIIVRTSQFSFQFYEKYGFKLIKCTKDYWAKGIDLYKMSYKLGQ